jgi:ATP-dependent helicase/nuclease subunit A
MYRKLNHFPTPALSKSIFGIRKQNTGYKMDNYFDTAKSVMISAPAGSGKTEKLARRYISLLQNSVDVERILAITFTDKAAAEMKQRILNILKKEDRTQFVKLLAKMPLMRVSTIHSFCGTLLRRFSFEASVDPNYRIEDALDSSMAWEDTLYEVLMDAGKGTRGHDLFLQTIGEKGFRGLDYLKRTMDFLYQKTPFSLKAGTFKYTPFVSETLTAELRSWYGISDVIESYESLFDKDGFKQLAAVEKYFLTDKKTIRKRPVPELKHITDYHDWASKMYLYWKDIKVLEHERKTERLREIYVQCMSKYTERKKARGVLDFGDLEFLAFRMLTEHPEWANILYAFDEKTDHVLVDEFQDTNSFQWEIINKLTEEWRSGMGAKREEGIQPTVFFVGDEKQSIYYFRGANVEIFQRARDRMQEWLGDEFCYEEVKDNYRSMPAIVEFTNHVFSKVMHIGEKSFPWTTRYAAFNARRTGIAGTGHVELILLDDEESSVSETRQQEAEIIARRIQGLAGSYQISDRESCQQRQCRYMDMAILLRKRTHLKKYEEALRQYNIPYVAVKGIGFYQEPEIAMLRALVFFFSNPRDDYSLYTVLKSPLFNIEEGIIIDLIETKGDCLYSKLLQTTDGNLSTKNVASPESGTLQLRNAALMLREWLLLIPHTNISGLIEHVLISTRAWVNLHTAQTRANIKKFIRIIEDMEAGGKSLMKLRVFLERTFNKNEEAKANVNAEGMDAVKIMTIHAAKGLEFPVVFVPGIEERFSSMTGENIVCEREGKFYFKCEPESSIRKQDDNFLMHLAREEEEQKRLFYVAVTRAEDALVLTGQWSGMDRNFLAYLRCSLGLEHKGSDYNLNADIKGLSVLNAEDVKMLYGHAPGKKAAKTVMKPVSVIPMTTRRQQTWRTVTESVDVRRRHGKDWTVLGDIIHRIFENISKGVIEENDIRDRAKKMLERKGVFRASLEEKLDLIDTDIKTLKQKGVWQKIIMPKEDAYTEHSFILDYEDSVFTGRIDRIIRNHDTYMIYDYKTFPVREEEVNYLIRQYSGQLRIYKKAVEQLFNTDKIKSFIVFTHTGDVREI